MKRIVAAAMLAALLGGAAPVLDGEVFLFESDSAAPPVIEGSALSLVPVIRPILGRDRLFIETSTMRKSGNIADAWMLAAYVQPESEAPGETHDGRWLSLRFDCKANTAQPRAAAWVNADGRTHRRVNLQQAAQDLGPHDAYHPENVYHYAADIACGRWDWRLSGKGQISAAAAIADVRLPVPPGYEPILRPPPLPGPGSPK